MDKGFDVVGFCMDFEEMDHDAVEANKDKVVAGFQYLIDSGLAWSLQGSYGRYARYLIDMGWCREAK